jgi:hypothetical protein
MAPAAEIATEVQPGRMGAVLPKSEVEDFFFPHGRLLGMMLGSYVP